MEPDVKLSKKFLTTDYDPGDGYMPAIINMEYVRGIVTVQDEDGPYYISFLFDEGKELSWIFKDKDTRDHVHKSIHIIIKHCL